MKRFINPVLTIILLSVFFYLFYTLFTEDPSSTGEYDMILIIPAIFISLFLTFILTNVLSFHDFNPNKCFYLVNIFEKRSHFQYKNNSYYTIKDVEHILVYKINIFRFNHTEIGSFINTDEVNLYKSELKSLIEEDIQKRLSIRLEKRKDEVKFKKYNEL